VGWGAWWGQVGCASTLWIFFKQMKHCNKRRCIKSVFYKCVNAHKEDMKWKASCNLVQYIVAMHLIKCWSQVLHNSHHDRLCKPLCCSRFFRKNLWKNNLALRLLDANVGLWKVRRGEWKEWERKKEREGGGGK